MLGAQEGAGRCKNAGRVGRNGGCSLSDPSASCYCLGFLVLVEVATVVGPRATKLKRHRHQTIAWIPGASPVSRPTSPSQPARAISRD